MFIEGVIQRHEACIDVKTTYALHLTFSRPRALLSSQDGYAPAQVAVKHGRSDALKVLLEHGADLAAKTKVRGLLEAY